jgi:hypothetical protein
MRNIVEVCRIIAEATAAVLVSLHLFPYAVKT